MGMLVQRVFPLLGAYRFCRYLATTCIYLLKHYNLKKDKLCNTK